jgi:hypothetical protein
MKKENKEIEIINLKKFQTSIYSSAELKNIILVGGSNWNRRNKKYSKTLAKHSKGILHIFEKKK